MNQSKQMKVCSEVELTAPAAAKHLREMKSAAERITDDQSSVRTWVDRDGPKSVFAECTIPKARQMDVVDRIMHEFALYMEDYSTQSVWSASSEKTKIKKEAQPAIGRYSSLTRRNLQLQRCMKTNRKEMRW